PVDWYAWGPEALERARETDRPILLSVGYSACHWCHVMERESFEDPDTAAYMNEHFVPIKVDREERPDVDSIYMEAVQGMTGHGGWPLTAFLDPDGVPFYGGTYFPPEPRHGMPSFRMLMEAVVQSWTTKRDEIRASADRIKQQLGAIGRIEAVDEELTPEVVDQATRELRSGADMEHGGFGSAPKFPPASALELLLARGVTDVVEVTLDAMAFGGIYDQIGGGFARYSVDDVWLVPHFEKMLYDNALLVPAYVEAWQATKDGFFRTVAEDVLAYVAREMTDPSGAFWSATDADSEGEEGRFFAWTVPQLRDALGPLDGDRAATIFNATESGNFEGSNVLSLSHVPDADERAFLDRIRPILREVRAKRPPPLTDRKIITAWNGLMISAFARAGFAFARKDLIDRAARAADHLLAAHRPAGKLARSSMGGEARHAGLLEDHAFLAAALVDLFEATGDARYLREGRALHAEMSRSFADRDGGAFFRTPSGHEELIAREKPSYDGAEPTGNSVAALTLQRLAALTGDDSHREECEKLFRSFGSLLANVPLAVGEMLLAVDFALAETREVVIVRPAGGSDDALLDPLRQKFLPWQVLVRSVEGNDDLSRETPLVRDRPARDARAAAYVCQHGACQLPVTGRAELEKLLG
ncbi:MAG: thioredoxin domain-containing protein, partial [Myxococcales bacterium]